jgi:NADH:ubiquinone oxidoreductase subunit E
MAEASSHDVVRFEHPGAGRRRARVTPKGREVLPDAKNDIATLLGDRPRTRDLLIEHLHRIQDAYHRISAAHLAALADEMRLSFAEVFETATFYAHFDVVKENELDPPPLTVRVCDSVTCALFGGERLLTDLQSAAEANGPDAGIRVVRAPCLGLCDHAPAAEVGHNFLYRTDPAAVLAAVASDDTHTHLPTDTIGFDAYVAGGGYQLLGKVRSGALSIAVWVAPVSPPRASGARCAASRARG